MSTFESCHLRFTCFRLHELVWATSLASSIALPLHAQTKPPPAPSVFVREIRIDPLLVSFGVDVVRIRSAMLELLNKAGRLATERTHYALALDIALTVPRPAGGDFGPSALLRVEVGRNLMESGTVRSLVWESTMHLGEIHRGASRNAYLTWAALAEGAPSEILAVVDTFLKLPRAGA